MPVKIDERPIQQRAKELIASFVVQHRPLDGRDGTALARIPVGKIVAAHIFPLLTLLILELGEPLSWSGSAALRQRDTAGVISPNFSKSSLANQTGSAVTFFRAA